MKNNFSFLTEIMQFKSLDLSRRHIWLILFLSGCFGFLISGLSSSYWWQDAVESGQVVAGIIKLPKDNPGYIYHLNAYSLITQAAAFLLRLGLSEKAVSFIFSGLQGAFSFSAISACTLALSRMPVLSLAAPFLSKYLHAYDYGHNYPVFITGAPYTFGVLGLALLFLIIGLFSLGENKIAALLLGLMPALHLTLGIFGWLIIGVTLLLEFRRFHQQIPQILRFFFIGTIIFFLSYAYHRFFQQYTPGLSPNLISQYYSLYMRNVDGHIIPVGLISEPFFVALYAAILSLCWLLFFRKDLHKNACFMLYAFIICFIIGFSYTAMFHFFRDLLPFWVMTMLPNRLMNLNSLGIFPFILGLLGLYSDYLPFSVIFILFLSQIPLLVLYRGIHIGAYATGALYFMVVTSTVLIVKKIIFKDKLSQREKISNYIHLLMHGISSLLIIFMLLSVVYAYKVRYPKIILMERSEQPFFSLLGKRPGLLLTAPFFRLIQTRARRPVLLDMGSLDIIRYIKESGPGIQEILQKVYGINDFFTRRRNDCVVDYLFDRIENVFQERSLLEWKKIAREFGFTDVMVPGDWKLNLPLVRESPAKEYAFYSIPEEEHK